ncbi:MAG TPA: acyl-CoA dehydrogenase family protein [Acidimicrobiales bacterium]|nr:acyl-CoA dehydrogenase family protein [Acidimicrobiales bacterium]
MTSVVQEERRLPGARTVSSVEAELRAMLSGGALDLPRTGHGSTQQRWVALAGWGRRDLALARLAEGHADAVAILAEADRAPEAGLLYGVWAARSGGTGARLRRGSRGLMLGGSVRFCSGARSLDRALVVADPSDGPGELLLVDVALTDGRVRARPETWQTAAMDAADTQDVDFDDLPVDPGAIVGDPGWYTGRPGFAIGGAGVAAVWWGGARGVLDRVIGHLPEAPDAHQLAHLGELHALLEASDALVARAAAVVDATPAGDHRLTVATVRSAVERAVREVVDRAPRMVGPAPLSRDAELAHAVADLQLYVRQHHGERDHAALGEQLVARWRAG